MIRILKKQAVNIFIVTAVLAAFVILVFFTHGFNEVICLFAGMQYRWIAAAFGCMFIFWLGDALALQIIVGRIFKRQRFLDSVKAAMVGIFFNAVTPFATGGQPAMVYVMARNGMKPGHAASAVLVKSVTYQSVIVLYSFFVIVLKGRFFMERIPGFFYLYLLGFLLNLFVVSLYVLFIYRRDLARKIIMFLFNLTQKLKILERLAKYERKLESELEAFGRGARVLKNNIPMLYYTCLIQAGRLSFFFLIPWLIYKSIKGMPPVEVWDMIAVQSIVTMIASYVPSPGAAGGAEGAGYVFFSLFFGTGIVIPVLLIWRIITYYSNLLFGGVVSALIPEKT